MFIVIANMGVEYRLIWAMVSVSMSRIALRMEEITAKGYESYMEGPSGVYIARQMSRSSAEYRLESKYKRRY